MPAVPGELELNGELDAPAAGLACEALVHARVRRLKCHPLRVAARGEVALVGGARSRGRARGSAFDSRYREGERVLAAVLAHEPVNALAG